MRRRDRLLRLGVGFLLLAGSFGVVIPLGIGIWNPSWLRLAGDVELDPTQPSLEPGQVRHPFAVEQCDLNGRLRWRLSGAGLRGPSDAVDLLRDQVVLEPRLELFNLGKGKPGSAPTRISAKQARIQVFEGEQGGRRVRLDLGPSLVLERGGLSLRGEELVVWFDPDQPSQLRLRAEKRLSVRFTEAGARWEFEAAGLEADAKRIVLEGPVALRGGPFESGPLADYRVEGTSEGAVLEAREDGVGGPWRLQLEKLELQGKAHEGRESFALAARRAGVSLTPAPVSSQGAPGGVTGFGPGARPTPGAFVFEGEVRGQFTGVQPDLEVRLKGDRLLIDKRSRLVLTGRHAEIAERRAGFHAAGSRFELQRSPAGTLQVNADQVKSIEFREAAPTDTPATAPATWRGRAGSFALEIDGVAALGSQALAQVGLAPVSSASQAPPKDAASTASVTTSAQALAWLDRVRSLEVRGGLQLARSPGPDRLEAELLRLIREPNTDPEGPVLRRLQASGLRALLSQPGAATAPLGSRVAWAIEAGTLELTTRGSLADLAALGSASTGAAVASASTAKASPPWVEPLALLESLSAAGGVTILRRGQEADPRRKLRKARGLEAAGLEFSQNMATFVARGQVRATVGALTLEAPELSLIPATGLVRGRQLQLNLVRLVATPKGGYEREEYRAQAREGQGTLSLDPLAWASERERRRGRRRSGAALTVPEPLESLELRGGVVAEGPRGVQATANRVRLRGRRLVLEGSPARLAEERGLISARIVRLSWEEASLAPLASGVVAPRDATRARLEAEGQVSVEGKLGERRFTLSCQRTRAELFEVVGVPSKDPRAPFPLGAFEASGSEGVTLTWLAPQRSGGSRELKLRTARLRGQGRAKTPQGEPALLLEFRGRWATTLALPKRGLAQVSGGKASAYLDPLALRDGAKPDEREEAYLRRLLRGLEVSEGLRLTASGFEARAKTARLDTARSAYVLTGDPVVLRRGGLRQSMRQATIRLSEE